MGKNKEMLFLVLIILILVFVGVSSDLRFKSKNLITINTEQLGNNLNSGKEFLLYVGRPSCNSCKSFLPKLKRYMRGGKIYYYNTDDMKKENKTDGIELLKNLHIDNVPVLIKIENGKETQRLENYQDIEIMKEWIVDNG